MNEKLYKKLIELGLKAGLAAIIATNSKAELTDDEIETISKQYSDEVLTVNQSEIDKRVTQAVNTAVANYEKKHGLKDGKPIQDEPPITPEPKIIDPKGPEPTDPNIKALMDLIAKQNENFQKLQQSVEGIEKQKAQELRSAKIKKLLTDAKIPEALQKHFIAPEEATDEELTIEVNTYKQGLADAGLAGLIIPGKGGGTKEPAETYSKEAAEKRNQNNDGGGIVTGIKL
jgi:hypothetical protein